MIDPIKDIRLKLFSLSEKYKKEANKVYSQMVNVAKTMNLSTLVCNKISVEKEIRQYSGITHNPPCLFRLEKQAKRITGNNSEKTLKKESNT